METKEVNLIYFKHQSLQLLAIIKQLQIEDQYDAIIYILSAINTYLKNVFTSNDREIVNTKILSDPELIKGHVNDVLDVIKEEEKVGQSVTTTTTTTIATTTTSSITTVKKFNQLVQFPYYIRGNDKIKVLYNIKNRYVDTLFDVNNFSYKDWVKWTSGINQVNKLKTKLKARVIVKKTIVPRPIKRSASLPAASHSSNNKIPKKTTVRSLSTSVRTEKEYNSDACDGANSDFELTNHKPIGVIDYDELILNPALEQKLSQVSAASASASSSNSTQNTNSSSSPKLRRLSKDDPKKIIVLENRVIMEAELSVPKILEPGEVEDDDDEEEPKPTTNSDTTTPPKKPPKKRKTHPCVFCKKSYRSRKSLMLHFQHHPGFCPDCGDKIGETPQEIVAHNRQFHIIERPIICEICGESFTRNQQYQVHLQNHDKTKDAEEPPPKYGCLECGMIFQNQKLLEKHITETEHRQDKRLCDICGIDFDTNTKLLQHLRRAHKPKSFTCEICNKEFTLKCNLDRHVKSIHTINPTKRFVCECCGNEYSSQNSLNEHAEVAHKKSKVYQCTHCEKTFFIKRLLKVHEIVHSEYRPHQCPQCDQAYKRRSHLDRHMHFSHNKNGKVTIGGAAGTAATGVGDGSVVAGTTTTTPGIIQQNGEDVVGIKPPKVPKTKKQTKSDDKLAKPNTSSIQQYDNSQSSFGGYDMQAAYGDPNHHAAAMTGYNNHIDHHTSPHPHVQQQHPHMQQVSPVIPPTQPHTQQPQHPQQPHQHHPQHMPMQNDPNAMGMYHGYSDAAAMQQQQQQQQQQPTRPPVTPNTNDFTNQYYLQENAVSWDNMQLYNNGAMSNDNMNYPVKYDPVKYEVKYEIPGVNNDYMQQVPPAIKTEVSPDPTGSMLGMPPQHQDMYGGYRHPQDPHHHAAAPNMWNAAANQNQNNSYNSIGNILTNLELIGNNSNFENSFDIVTSQVENNQQAYPDHSVMQPHHQQPHPHQHHPQHPPHPHPHPHQHQQHQQYNMQYHDPQAQYHHHMNYGT